MGPPWLMHMAQHGRGAQARPPPPLACLAPLPRVPLRQQPHVQINDLIVQPLPVPHARHVLAPQLDVGTLVVHQHIRHIACRGSKESRLARPSRYGAWLAGEQGADQQAPRGTCRSTRAAACAGAADCGASGWRFLIILPCLGWLAVPPPSHRLTLPGGHLADGCLLQLLADL